MRKHSSHLTKRTLLEANLRTAYSPGSLLVIRASDSLNCLFANCLDTSLATSRVQDIMLVTLTERGSWLADWEPM